MTFSSSTSWHGWLWFDGSWHRVCDGDSLSECARRLGVEGHRRGVPVRHQAMTGGAPPDFLPIDILPRTSAP